MLEFSEWDSFYLIVGGAAGALIGLQFVVMTLIADRPQLNKQEAGHAFATPTTMHFAASFVLSALLRAPWKSIGPVTFIWALIGSAGVLYTIVVIRRISAQSIYKPVFEDWLFHAILPLAAYTMLVISAFTADSNTREALFVSGGSALLLLMIGIHNAWDTTTYNVFVTDPKSETSQDTDDKTVQNQEDS